AFVEERHPLAPLTVHRSTDHGRTWRVQETKILPDSLGQVPAMHMNERGITLLRGPHAGRLIRATRWYGGGNDPAFWPGHCANAIYNDDGGETWRTSEPFPARGTGEAAIVELSDGRLHFNSRRHLATDGRDPRRRHVAWSHDGGVTWQDLAVSEELPDGDQSSDYGLMAGLVRLPMDGCGILLFSTVDSRGGRRRGSVWAGFHGGRTWPVKRLVDEGGFAYSSPAVGRSATRSEGWVYLLYETGGHPDSAARLARFNLAWVTEGRDWRGFLPNDSEASARRAAP
ncbi:MAG TPA: sialidase family protein, partial [Verrucomicrobiota bacterium]|nr:sialidase family protein [Verrucomicrobiota bacterium]